MSKEPIVRANPQTAEDKQIKHYAADWWVYIVLALFIGGLIFMTYMLTIRGDVMNEFGKPGSKTALPPAAQSAPAAPAAAPAPAEKK
ncbi:MAG: hypothetical protein FJY34_00320 [Betaproteobacteria bacterium]|nr:hypothetical protein [Betaproteobacteria bacterium]